MVYMKLHKHPGMPLKRQIYACLREMILAGRLKPGEKLPPSRKLAEDLNVSRNTVVEALEMLTAEGYLKGVSGSGIYIHDAMPDTRLPEKVADYIVSPYSGEPFEGNSVSFQSGTPDLSLFPRAKWSRYAREAFLEAPVSAFGYDYPHGRPEFRSVLARYLKKTRNIHCEPEDIIVTTGAKQAITIIAKALLNPDSTALLEDPSNGNVRKIFSYHTEHIVPLATDGGGIVTDRLPSGLKPALIFTTPSHQFPMGGFLPIHRRLKLLQYARDMDCYIVEDDYDSEFCYKGYPVSAMQGLESGRIVYIGTFSKTLYPSLRIGYMVLPPALSERCREIKRLEDHHTNSLNQLALMRFIEDGELERHIAKMKKVYKKRRDVLIDLLMDYFGDTVKILGEQSGMHVVCEFEDTVFTPELLAEIGKNGVTVSCVEEHALVKGLNMNRLILGYAHLAPEAIETGLLRIKQALSSSR
jgi:GntR family transcriptional regulator/MocR family aminotransferase